MRLHIYLLVKYSSDLGALSYAEALDWRGLVNVFTKSLSDSTLDEMVLLLYSKAQKFQGWVSRYVRTVMYENLEEILDHLRAKAAGCADPRAQTDLPEGHPIEPENEDDQQKHPALPEEDVLSPGDDEPPVDNGGHEETLASPEEIRVAHKIEAAYHRVITRKKEVLKGRSNVFLVCVQKLGPANF